MSWYRTYRPTTVAGLHLASVREALLEVMKTGLVPHALLLTGPKGTGKTSTARILAAVLNDPANAQAVAAHLLKGDDTPHQLQEPDPQDDVVKRIFQGSSTTVFELDAASNRGIDDIRLLRERVMLPPQEGLISVYILDEVHMLTIEAFNALLKLLEEPPAHAVFILATTELHKVPETIVSRCRVIQFHKAASGELASALNGILEQQKIASEAGAVELIAEHADGSFRDAVKTLEALASGQKALKLVTVQDYFHTQAKLGPVELIEIILAKDEKAAVSFFEQLRSKDVDSSYFYKRFLQYLHDQLLAIVQVSDAAPLGSLSLRQVQFLLTQFNGLMGTSGEVFPFLSLELKTLDVILRAQDKGGTGQVEKKVPATSSVVTKTTVQAVAESVQNVQPVAILEQVEIELEAPAPQWKELPTSDRATVASGDGQLLLERWEDFLAQMKSKNSSIEALLRSARPLAGETGKARIEVYYQFHKETLQQPKFMSMIDECVSLVVGGKVRFDIELAKQAQAGAALSTVSGQVNPEDGLIQLAKEILV